jgi:peptidoglycan/LPS O-acetylase OafA/YrhL
VKVLAAQTPSLVTDALVSAASMTPPTTSSSGSSGAIPALTGLRGYAALWVLVSHISYTNTFSAAVGERLGWKHLNGLLRHEYLAVDLFFVLSGFVLTHAHGRELDERIDLRTYLRFLLLRLARVYPLHLVALLTMLGLHFVAPSGSAWDSPGNFVLHLTMTASWGFARGLSWNPPAWSLSSEWLAYVVLPMIMLVTAGLRRVRPQLVALGVIAAAFGGLFFTFQFPPFDYSDGHGASARVLFGVVIGSVLRRVYDQPAVRRLPWSVLFWLGLPIAVASMTDLSGRRLDNSLAAYLSVVFVVFAAACASPRALFPFTSRVPVYLGEISYAVYIFHYPVLRIVGLLASSRFDAVAKDASPLRAQLLALGATIIVVCVAALAHHAVEEPVRRRARRWIDARFPRG